jgi:hypothetical protein
MIRRDAGARRELTIGTLLMALRLSCPVYDPLGITHPTGTIRTFWPTLAAARTCSRWTEGDDGEHRLQFDRMRWSSLSGRSIWPAQVQSREPHPRFYDPAGQVLVDGRDSCTYRLMTLREQIAIAEQEAIVSSAACARTCAEGGSMRTTRH